MSALTTSIQFGLGGAWLAEHTLRSVGAGLAVFDQDARLAQADERAAELLCGPETPAGVRLDDPRFAAIHLDGAPLDGSTDPIRAALAVESSSVADVVGILTDEGETRWLAVTALPLPGLDGTTQAALVSLIEVTGIVRDRAAVDAAEHIGRSAFDHGATPMCIVDAAGALVDWNRAFARRVDRPDYELMATSLDSWVENGSTISSAAVGTRPGEAVATTWDGGRPVDVRAWSCDTNGSGRVMVEFVEEGTPAPEPERMPVDVAAVIVDGCGRIATGNALLTELLGSAIGSLRGNRLELFLDMPAEAFQRYVDGVRSSLEPRRFETRLFRLGGDDTKVEVEVMPSPATRSGDVIVPLVDIGRS